MKPVRFLLTVPLCYLLLTCCHTKDPEPDLPAETQTGANTFGCRFNGQAWIPEANKPADYNRYFTYYYDPSYGGGNLDISASNFKKGGGISITLFNMNKIGVYDLSQKMNARIRVGDGRCYY